MIDHGAGLGNVQFARRPPGQFALTLLLLLLAVPAGLDAAQSVPATAPAETSIEDEVYDNVVNQKIGDQTLKVLNLPASFIRRVADRIIQGSYVLRYHMVVADSPPPSTDAPVPSQTDPGENAKGTAKGKAATPEPAPGESATNSDRPANDASQPDTTVRLADFRCSDSILTYRLSLPETWPPLRGFAAAILGHANDPWPFQLPTEKQPAAIRRAADVVGTRLATDHLLPTLVSVVDILGDSLDADDPAEALLILRSVGFPVDVITYFSLDGTARSGSDPGAFVAHIIRGLGEPDGRAKIDAELKRAVFRFRPSAPGFTVATESGENPIKLVRLQLTRGNYWQGIGAGGCLDVARDVVGALPDADFVAAIQQTHVADFLETAKRWPLKRAHQLTLLSQPYTVSQWAQDNGKAGVCKGADGSAVAAATLVPRYASRREEGSVFVPGESFQMDSLARANHRVIQSPLLFQGGNLLAVRQPASGERILLVGEAEVYRNVALGLTEAQTMEAFRVELGVDRCVKLPAVSFHVDFDLTVRARGDELVAFVNDTDAAVRFILLAGVDALEHAQQLPTESAAAARKFIQTGQVPEFMEIISAVLGPIVRGHGAFPESFADHFAASEVDSGVGNLQRFLVAIDIFARDASTTTHRHTAAYIRSLKRQQADREALYRLLAGLGWKVVPVPSLSLGDRSINYVNGVQDKTRYLMPAYGGLFAPLDKAAKSVFEKELGPDVRVIEIASGESQRRMGAVHCSMAAYPRPTAKQR